MTDTLRERRVLLVEDDLGLRQNYALALERAGLCVRGVSTAPEALAEVDRSMPDATVIDIGLGADGEAGFALCRDLRVRSRRLPILFLSARDDELDVISGLRLGADDYLTKDISLAQLVARVLTVLRRVDALGAGTGPEVARHAGSLALLSERLEARWRGRIVELTVTEFRLVECLATRPGQVRSRAQLMTAAELVLDDQTITAHIKRIRRKFEALDAGFSAIGTVYGLGYRWVVDA